MRRSGYSVTHGDWNAICDVCGFKFKASQLRRRWDGFMVCSEDYEERHPQDLLRVRPDRQSVPWVRPEPEDVERVAAPADPSDL
jgi:hypothetical protein